VAADLSQGEDRLRLPAAPFSARLLL